uniref:Uncharacterized protein n=1 Tax=Loxodonta africana TaxID=9785 RepID=G3U569_LOXAF
MSILAFRIIYQIVKKPRPKVKEAPSEEIAVEPIHYLQRVSRARRSSYAFSHREGYANLITQGTIMRRARDTNSELMNDDQPPSEDDIPPSFRDPTWHPRRLSFLVKRKHQRMERISSERMCPSAVESPSLPVGRQTPSDFGNQSKSLNTRRSPSSGQRLPSSRD